MSNASTPPDSVPRQPKGLLDWVDPLKSDDVDRVRAQLHAKIGKLSDVNVQMVSNVMDAFHMQEWAGFLIDWYDDPEDMGKELTVDGMMRYIKGRWTVPE